MISANRIVQVYSRYFGLQQRYRCEAAGRPWAPRQWRRFLVLIYYLTR